MKSYKVGINGHAWNTNANSPRSALNKALKAYEERYKFQIPSSGEIKMLFTIEVAATGGQ